MKKIIAIIVVLCLIAVPALAEEPLINDQSGILSAEEVAQLEEKFDQCRDTYGFTPVFVSTSSFDGLDSIEYANQFYDAHGYSEDGILLLLSLEEGYWHILTSGACYDRIETAELNGLNDSVAGLLLSGSYYDALVSFCDFSIECYANEYEFSEDVLMETLDQYGNVVEPDYEEEETPSKTEPKKGIGKKIAIGMAVGFGIGLTAVVIMLIPMKSVSKQLAAADYVRADSMVVTDRRDIYLYSRVRRMAKSKTANGGPKAPSSGGSGPKRGGIGGKL